MEGERKRERERVTMSGSFLGIIQAFHVCKGNVFWLEFADTMTIENRRH
jgi:hypothetical protein